MKYLITITLYFYEFICLLCRTNFELFEQFDSSEMVFNPSITVPQKSKPKLNRKAFSSQFVSGLLRSQCNEKLKTNSNSHRKLSKTVDLEIDFYKEIKQLRSNKTNL